MTRLEAFSDLNMEEVNTDDNSDEDWKEVFDRLDHKDGVKDGRIDKWAFLEWMDTLDFQTTVSLEAKQGISRQKLRRTVLSVDADRDDYIDKDEFLRLIKSYTGHLNRIEKNNLLKYMRIAAYAEEYRWWPPPCFTLLSCLVMVSIFVYHTVIFHQQGRTVTWSAPSPTCSPLIFDPNLRIQVWRFFTYSLVHSGYEHILVNVLLMLLVGLSLEMTNSWWRVATVYSLGVISGSLLSSVVHIHPGTFLAGASGGVYALASAHIATIILNWKEDSLILRQRLRKRKTTSPTFGRFVRVARILVVVSLPLVDLVTFIMNVINEVNNTTSYLAHGSGVVMGLLVGLVILNNRRVEFWETWLRLLCCLTAVAIILILVVLNIVLLTPDLETINSSNFSTPVRRDCEKFLL